MNNLSRYNLRCTIGKHRTLSREIWAIIKLIIVKYGTSLHSWQHLAKTYSLLSGQDYQAIQACNCKVILFKSVRQHDDGSSEHTLGFATLRPVYILKTRHQPVYRLFVYTISHNWTMSTKLRYTIAFYMYIYYLTRLRCYMLIGPDLTDHGM